MLRAQTLLWVPAISGCAGLLAVSLPVSPDANHSGRAAVAMQKRSQGSELAAQLLGGVWQRKRYLWVYWMSLSLLTRWPLPRSRKRVVMRPSTPTGPRAWMRAVEMPTCA